VIQTDHRPLLGLLKRLLDEMSPRIQRLAFRLLRYQFELQYVPGKKLQIADTLSRDPTEEIFDTKYLEENLRVYSIIVTTPENEKRLKEALNSDPVLKIVKNYVEKGWPTHKTNVPVAVKKYWFIRNEIFLHKDILFYKRRIIVPESLKQEFLTLLHEAHQGVVSTNLLAQESVYWPGITSEIEDMVLSCPICQHYSRSNTREPLQSHKVPDLPWQKIGIDFKTMGSIDFIIVVDYFSKFIVVNKLTNKTAATVISSLKNIFAIMGLPQEIFSDNGPPFNSREFASFASKYQIKTQTSSPNYPASNGMVERAIQTVKSLLTKSYEDSKDSFAAVLNYNITPKPDMPSPSQLIMGRRLRTTLPVTKSILRPIYSLKGVKKTLENRQTIQKHYFDRKAKALPKLKPNQLVLVQKGIRKWYPGVVKSTAGPNDYLVESENTVYRRNRRFLRPERNSAIETTVNEPARLPNVTVEKKSSTGSETDGENKCSGMKTRSGRLVKPPHRLDL